MKLDRNTASVFVTTPRVFISSFVAEHLIVAYYPYQVNSLSGIRVIGFRFYWPSYPSEKHSQCSS